MAARVLISQLSLPAPSAGRLKTWLQAELVVAEGAAMLGASNDGAPSYCLTQIYDPPAIGRFEPPLQGASRYIGVQVSDTGPSVEASDVTLMVAFDVPLEWRAEIDAWYRDEHIDLLMRADGWLRARRYNVEQTLAGRRFTSIALHDLRDASVMNAPERMAARATPWRGRFSSEPWFEHSGRWLYSTMAETEIA